MTTESKPRRTGAYLSIDEGVVPVRTREWPKLVQQLGAWPAIQKALLLQENGGVQLDEAAQRAGVHIDTVRGWQRAASRAKRSGA